MNETDLLLINRSGKDYALPAREIEALTDDADLLVVNRDGVDYKVSGKDIKDYLFASLPEVNPDGDLLGNSVLVVFEVIEPMRFEDCNNSWDQNCRVPYWYNGQRFTDFPCYFHLRHNVQPGDIFAIQLPPSMWDIRTYTMGGIGNINLALTDGKIHLLPETNILYLTDETLREWTSYKGNGMCWLLTGEWHAEGEINVTGFENVRLNPELSVDNPMWHLYAQGGKDAWGDLRDFQGHGPEEKPSKWPSRFEGQAGVNIMTEATYGLMANNYYMQGVSVRMPVWRVFRGEKYVFDDWRKYQGIWHIKNVESSNVLLNKTCTAWNIDGSNEREINEIAIGEEVVICSTDNAADLFCNNTGTWDFGRLTNTTAVKDMSGMFRNCTSFNGEFGGDFMLGSVTTLSGMFEDTGAFNQDISDWSISNKDLSKMFMGAQSFNQNLGVWRPKNMSYMFASSNFNNTPPAPNNSDDVSYMFADNKVFDTDLGWGNVGKVRNFSYMFHNATAFNQDLPWSYFHEEDPLFNMDHMFDGATSFNQALKYVRDVGGWCVVDIASEPSGFDTGATKWTLSRPAWGQPCE